MTGTVLVSKLDNDFIILWDDPMKDGSVPIIIIFQLFKQSTLFNADKNCTDNDFFVTVFHWDKCLTECKNFLGCLCEWFENKHQKGLSFMKINFFSFDYDFWLIHFIFLFFFIWRHSYVFNTELKYVNFSVDKNPKFCRFLMSQNRTNSASKFWAHVNVGVGGQPSISFSDAIDVCPLKGESKHGKNLSNLSFSFKTSVPDTLTKMW